ncbi:zinc dependent phospholipase C family protein [Nitratidesulfovibrio termitidis]|uniref:zinc dependent phospholipase C family protein n=1 Tax=Nitratidesulfovibrio termitidis TaxID=42252 RepID=UPI000428E240|nr:zinc dependent phospholipase C family protein [Nitratidesulfovibrio termitidis]
MPGAYAHLNMVMYNTDADNLAASGLPDAAAGLVLQHPAYAELGAISPDMPYLAHFGLSNAANRWADRMHHARTGARLRAGADAVHRLGASPAQAKAFAWLLGFASHVVFDVTMHPVVNARVGGAYGPDTRAEHQKCEMHQDAYIIQEFHGLDDPVSAHIVSTGLKKLFRPGDPDRLDPAIATVWRKMLEDTGDITDMGDDPDIDDWFDGFTDVMHRIETERLLLALGRHVAPGKVYPKAQDVDASYLAQLATPAGPMAYRDIYEKAAASVREMWGSVHRAALLGEAVALAHVGAWNLDTGLNDDGSGKHVFWG